MPPTCGMVETLSDMSTTSDDATARAVPRAPIEMPVRGKHSQEKASIRCQAVANRPVEQGTRGSAA